ncbi:MAG TPA: NERD domain-containing protein [Actinomycetota bacterium]|nr:NERD domain-containing protein [Actinomycetota bacterium]
MAIDPNQQWASIELGERLVGRRPGSSARERAQVLRAAQPVRTRLAQLLGVHTDERAWRKGAEGERVTGLWLGRLPEGWHVFHDIPVGERGANIDHLVIGPGGVFTINTKNLTGKIWVGPKSILHNGHRTDLLPKAKAEALRASRLLSAVIGRPIEARSVLAILADGWTIKEEPADVFVRGPRSAKNLMLKQPAALSPHEVIELAAAAAKPGTWIDAVPSERCGCGGHMVPRTRKTDGERFFGCTRFPTCRRTRSIVT